MGFQDRDYYRSDPRGGVLGGVATTCKWLIIVNIAVFVLQLLTNGAQGEGVTGWLQLSPARVLSRFELWRLLTYAFCHDPHSLLHLLFNMWMLWLCGQQVEAIYGAREFLKFYLAAAVAAGCAYLLFGLAISRLNPLIGASGAVLAVTAVCAMYYPTQRIMVLFIIPLELRWLVMLAVIFDLYPILMELGGGGNWDNVGHAAHLGGLLYGFLYKRYDLRFARLFGEWRPASLKRMVKSAAGGRGSSVRIYEPPKERVDTVEFNQQVDSILAKISEQGEGSLSDAEREILKEASRRYKQR